jgi:hypothetical protein
MIENFIIRPISVEKTNTIRTNMTEKIFVVSLPRSGTTTMCKMLNILGYKAKHTPSCFYDKWSHNGYNAFADTPCYSLSFIKEQSINPDSKFIYIERSVFDWVKSFESIALDGSYERMMRINNPKDINVVILNEIKAYGETFGFSGKYNRDMFMASHIEHKRNLEKMLAPERILFYNYNRGWKPLCDFLGKETPEENIPFLNKNKRGDDYEADISITL